MSAIAACAWNATDVPKVQAADLLAALSLWLARERQGMVLVTEKAVATIELIETAVIEMHAAEPARGLSVLLRLRCLIAALGSSRFRHLTRGHEHGDLAALVLAAASLRLNAGQGFSPVRLSWAMAEEAGAAASTSDIALPRMVA